MADQKITTQHQIERRGLPVHAESLGHDGFICEGDPPELKFIHRSRRCEAARGVEVDGGVRPTRIHETAARAAIDPSKQEEMILRRAAEYDLLITELLQRSAQVSGFRARRPGNRVQEKTGEQYENSEWDGASGAKAVGPVGGLTW